MRLRGDDPDGILGALRRRAPYLRAERVECALDGATELEVVLPTRRDAARHGWAEARANRAIRLLEAAIGALIIAALALLARAVARGPAVGAADMLEARAQVR